MSRADDDIQSSDRWGHAPSPLRGGGERRA
jgi:hypothetical protein